ncbi:MAG: hypothetical protein AMXMBFR61_03590 [Fimbriimonadales bacterium]
MRIRWLSALAVAPAIVLGIGGATLCTASTGWKVLAPSPWSEAEGGGSGRGSESPAPGSAAEGQQGDTGWHFRGLPGIRGDAELRIGAKFWKDEARVRNLQLRVSADIAPWLRAHTIVRRREGDWERMPLTPDVDEAYLQTSVYRLSGDWDMAVDAKLGRVRFLHFPYPDYLASFDQVPGIGDLFGGPPTDYRGLVTSFEAAHATGLGAHLDGALWGFGHSGNEVMAAYGFYRRDFGKGWRLEARAGALPNRPEPLGANIELGGTLFVGKRLGPVFVGGLYEKREGEGAYTGVLVQFDRGPLTEFAGATTIDYQRSPEGVSFQLSVARLRFGFDRAVPPGAELVGEITARRLRTLWQGGYNRNQAEFRTASWGITSGPNLAIVVEESPWYLDLEALVSPHTSLNTEWFRDRQGPGQYRQDVVYRFYRVKK